MLDYNQNEATIQGKNGINLAYRSWNTTAREKALVVIVHGLGDHAGRYETLINAFKTRGVSFYALDLRGHGKSQGKRGHVESFLDHVEDLKYFINHVKEINNEKPLILVGHSMGGSIAARYALTYQDDIDALVLSSPAFKPVVTKSQFMQTIAPFLSMIAPPFSVNSEIDPEKISHDPEAVKAYRDDDLVHDQITLKCWDEFSKNNENCLDRAMEIQLPVFIMHGTQDGIADIEGSHLFFDKISSTDKTFESAEGCFHEILNEDRDLRAKPLNNLVKWVLAHIKFEPKPEVRKSPLNLSVKSGAPKASPAKKTATKSAAKKSAAVKKTAAKSTAKKAAVKKAPVKKTTVKKATVKKAAVKKTTVKKAASVKSSAKKSTAKKAVKKTGSTKK